MQAAVRLGPIVSLLLLLLVCSPLALGAGAPGEPVAGPVTIETRFTLPQDPKAAGFVAAIPAGLAEPGSDVPTALALVWAESEASFFPTWNLTIHSDRGLLPSDPRYRVQSSQLLGTRFATIQTATPRWGHTYESAVSFDPQSGAVSIYIRNLTTGEEVAREILRVAPAEGAFVPKAGTLDQRARGTGGPAAGLTPLDDVTVRQVYIPRAVKWGLSPVYDGKPGSTTLSRVDRDTIEGVVLRLNVPGGDQGVFRFYFEGRPDEQGVPSFGRRPLAELAAPEGEVFAPLAWDQFPLGPSTLVLEYTKGGQTWFAESIPFAAGRIDASFSHFAFSQEDDEAQGTLTLKADGPLAATNIKVRADVSEMIWDYRTMRYRESEPRSVTIFEGALALSADPVEIPLAIPNPEETPKLWRARLHVEADNQVATIHLANTKLFGTYRRPEPITEGPYIIAVVGDPQYYSYPNARGGHPDMYIRQMAWLAENAAKERIGLVLLLGDITDHNLPHEWEVAHDSIKLLEGVVPYVITLGNHDLGSGSTASSRDTYYNRYFTAPPKDDRLIYGGSYRPGELENSYYFINLAGTEYIVFTLEFLPRDVVLDWANEVAARHHDKTAIVITHYFTSGAGNVSNSYGSYAIQYGPPGSVNSGVEMWNKFIRKHPNMFMVLSGHIHHDAMPRQTRFGDHMNVVYNFLVDYQFSENGGNGWLALFKFFLDQERVGVTVYSPTLGQFKSDNTSGYTVPFCIDLKNKRYVRVDEACTVALH